MRQEAGSIRNVDYSVYCLHNELLSFCGIGWQMAANFANKLTLTIAAIACLTTAYYVGTQIGRSQYPGQSDLFKRKTPYPAHVTFLLYAPVQKEKSNDLGKVEYGPGRSLTSDNELAGSPEFPTTLYPSKAEYISLEKGTYKKLRSANFEADPGSPEVRSLVPGIRSKTTPPLEIIVSALLYSFGDRFILQTEVRAIEPRLWTKLYPFEPSLVSHYTGVRKASETKGWMAKSVEHCIDDLEGRLSSERMSELYGNLGQKR